MGSLHFEQNSKLSVFIRLFVAFFFASSLPLITVMIHTNPSGAGPGSPFLGCTACVFVMTALFIGLWGIYSFLLLVRNKRFFVLLFFLSFAAIGTATILLGLTVHRDYFSHIFQVVLMYWLLFVFRNEFAVSLYSRKQFYSSLVFFNTAVFCVVMVWILLMGYAIATRLEPRWAESIVYNAYNLVLASIAGVGSLRLQIKRFRNIRMHEGKLYIDNWNFSHYFSDADHKIVSFFLSSSGTISCADLAHLLSDDDDEQNRDENKSECEKCHEEQYTATRCQKYKNIYNRIRNIKKLFESLEIGTIITPENKRRIKEEGWKLRLFDDVKVLLPSSASNRVALRKNESTEKTKVFSVDNLT